MRPSSTLRLLRFKDTHRVCGGQAVQVASCERIGPHLQGGTAARVFGPQVAINCARTSSQPHCGSLEPECHPQTGECVTPADERHHC
eukprot:1078144-Amphidinium_carterae.1